MNLHFLFSENLSSQSISVIPENAFTLLKHVYLLQKFLLSYSITSIRNNSLQPHHIFILCSIQESFNKTFFPVRDIKSHRKNEHNSQHWLQTDFLQLQQFEYHFFVRLDQMLKPYLKSKPTCCFYKKYFALSIESCGIQSTFHTSRTLDNHRN